MSGHHAQAALAEPFFPNEQPPVDPLWISEQRPWSQPMIQHYVERYSRPGDLVLDPFAAQAGLARAGAALHRRTVLSNWSPAGMLGVLATAVPPPAAVLDTAFNRIANAPRRGQTLAHYLCTLYETVCPACAQTAYVQEVVWDRDSGEPVDKRYTCPHCGSSGQAPADMADVNQSAGLELRGAAYWGLLSRLVAPGDQLTSQARALLDLYTPRSLLAISELVIATEQRVKEPDEQRAAKALLLHVLQRCTSLSAPSEPDSPDALRSGLEPPPRFVERNVWLAFEHAYHTLRSRPDASLWPAPDLAALLASEGEGRAVFLRESVPELGERLEPGSVALVLTETPTFAPAAYTLDFLWTGWLFGREAAGRLKSVLSIEYWGWDWYARAMATSLRALRKLLRPGGHLVLAFGDRSARRATALLVAASAAGFRLKAQAVQAPALPDDGDNAWRLVFELAERPLRPVQPAELAERLQQLALDAVQVLIEDRAEPVPQALMHTGIAIRWAEAGLLLQVSEHAEAARRPVSFLADQMRLALSVDLPPEGLNWIESPNGKSTAAGQWAPEQAPDREPLGDRVEALVADALAAGEHTAASLEELVYASFPGQQTPDAALLNACIASYTREADGRLHLRDEDQPERRARERGEMLLRLHGLGHRLGYQVWIAPREQGAALGLVPMGQGGPDESEAWSHASVVWHENGGPAFAFALAERAALHPWLASASLALEGCPKFAVLPGGRAELLAFKLRRSPAWRNLLVQAGWEFVKFRHVRALAALSDLTLAGFRARIALDPIVTLPGEQLELFEEALDAA